jgi:glycosyltransferase involved in cell wall biosynthesis
MKKVLVIVYYWPPSGGAGVQRWLKFVKYLPQFGWQPTVITTTNGDYPAIDESLCKEVPAGIKVIHTQTPTFGELFKKVSGKNSDIPYGSLEASENDSLFKKLSLWFRLNMVVPDARKIWNKFAFKAARKEFLFGKYDVVITSGPPHSTHLVGLKLKRKYNIKWIADFRDPWTKIDYLEKLKRFPMTDMLDRKLEKSVVQKCDRTISISRKIVIGLGAGKKADIISNGFDPADFKDIKRKESKKYFNINYFGNVTIERNPTPVLQAVNIIYEKQQNIHLNFWGNVSEEVRSKLTELDTNSIVSIHPYTPHSEMLQEMVNSSLLLLLINNVPNNSGIITGKLYEYLVAKVPVLGLGPDDGEAAQILKETNAGEMFDYDKVDGIANFIETKYQEWKEGKIFSASTEIEKYSKINQTKQLVEILGKI